MYGVIYKITNLINGKSYIGQTINKKPQIRIRAHFNKHPGVDLVYKASLKYGRENFKSELLCSAVDKESLNYLEQYFIETENTLQPAGYNIKKGGDQGGKLTDETKLKLSIKIKEWYKNNVHPSKGKKFSKQHIENLKKVRKGFTSPARVAASMRRAIQQRKRLKAINIHTNQEHIFDSITECCKSLNLNHPCVSRTLRNVQNRKQHRGFRFEKIH